ncbi:MAG: class I mannose-6-phosphate isomerase [Trueperaceae bacterium]|nr:class I mannose-6-phosphate isomerase [Trueperaceae bacterium]
MGPARPLAHAPFIDPDLASAELAGARVSASVPPLRVRPSLRRRPWGGDRLVAYWPTGEATLEPGTDPVGEAWLAGPDAIVATGPAAGTALSALARELGADFVGAVPFATYGARMPLLVKLLDAAEPLSVQVHPDDAYALREEAASGHLGKTEAWWVLEAAPDAHVWWGFARPVARDELERALAAGIVLPLLRRLPACAGDVVVNPAGTVHALGGGLIVYEVQQASDLTYRMDDHGRVGADGRPRPLHAARALDVARRDPGAAPAPEPQPTGPGRTELARTPAFVLERLDGGDGTAWHVGTGSLEVLTHVGGGPLEVRGDFGAAPLPVRSTLVLSAGTGPVEVRGTGVAARAWCPGARP